MFLPATTLTALLLLGQAIPSVEVPGERDAEWASYRHAYKAAAYFSSFTKTRPLIVAQMQVRPIDPKASLEGLRLRLVGEHVDQWVPVDAMGRSDLPMLKQAYEDDAVLRLNRGKDLFYFSGRYAVKPKDDGDYDAAELRAACEQVISAQRGSGYRMRLIGKKCAGIKFVYARAATTASVVVNGMDGKPASLPLTLTHPFEDQSMGLYQVAVYRFDAWPGQGKIHAGGPLLAVGTLYD